MVLRIFILISICYQALNGEDHGAVGVERLGVVADQTVKPQVVDGLVNVEEPQIGAALVERRCV